MRAVRFPSRVPAWLRFLSAICGCLLATGCVVGPDGRIVNALDVCVDSTDGSLCDDRQPCTIDDVCLNHVCTGTLVANGRPCTDGNVCTGPDQCQAGVCVGAMLADGTSCTDDNACTDSDVCRQGLCQAGAPRVCDDGNPCTIDTCVAPGGCLFSPRECAMPPDARPDMSIDLRVDVPPEVSPDVSPEVSRDLAPDLRPDLAADGAPPDTTSDAESPDGLEPDTGVPDSGIDDAPPDTGSVVPDDGGPDIAADAAPDAPDAPDAGRDATGSDLTETAPDLRVRGGGGCQCAWTGGTAPAPRGVLLAWLAAAAGGLALRRRRTCTPARKKS